MKQIARQWGTERAGENKRGNKGLLRAAVAMASGAGVLFAASAASAQQQPLRGGDFGAPGQFIIEGNRLFQLFAFDDVSQDVPGATGGDVTKVNNTTTSSTISLLYGSNGNTTASTGTPSGDMFFTVPRVGFDYVLLPNVTLGTDLVVLFTLGGHQSTETDTSNGGSTTVTTSNPSVTGFGITPRGGYILALTDQLSLWLRGGFSYYIATQKTSNTNAAGVTTTVSDTVDQFALDLEPQIVYSPFPHVGFTGGVTADIPLAGGISGTTTTGGTSASASANSSIFYLGVDLGMLVHF
jgi:hypothetical protein